MPSTRRLSEESRSTSTLCSTDTTVTSTVKKPATSRTSTKPVQQCEQPQPAAECAAGCIGVQLRSTAYAKAYANSDPTNNSHSVGHHNLDCSTSSSSISTEVFRPSQEVSANQIYANAVVVTREVSGQKRESSTPKVFGKRRLADFKSHPLHLAIYRKELVAGIKLVSPDHEDHDCAKESTTTPLSVTAESLNSECFLPPFRPGHAAYEQLVEDAQGTGKYMFSPLALVFALPRMVRSVETCLGREETPPEGWQEFLETWKNDEETVSTCLEYLDMLFADPTLLESWRPLVAKILHDGVDAHMVSALLDSHNIELGERLYRLVTAGVVFSESGSSESDDGRLLVAFQAHLQELRWRTENDIWI